ncbi:MAG: lipoyl synthase, partial [Rhodothermales bacterium]
MPENSAKRPFLPGEVTLKQAAKAPLLATGDGDPGFFELPVVEAPTAANGPGRRPDWLRVKLPYGPTYKNVAG